MDKVIEVTPDTKAFICKNLPFKVPPGQHVKLIAEMDDFEYVRSLYHTCFAKLNHPLKSSTWNGRKNFDNAKERIERKYTPITWIKEKDEKVGSPLKGGNRRGSLDASSMKFHN